MRILISIPLFFLCINSTYSQVSDNRIKEITGSVYKSALNCNNWLATPSNPSAVNIGDLDITGTQITVEASFNRTAPYSGSLLWAGDLVAKHVDPVNVNYLLRPNTAEITTSNGYYRTPDICEIELNKTYHAAMTYDGATLKFYRNGFLMSQVAANGTLFQNNFNTRIGYYDAALHNTQFIGYINEVRIWNVARSQAQVRQYMNSSLPSPTTQTGLQAYYTFDNLLNKQGNPAFNGVLNGSAAINATNPQCNFTADSCNIITPAADTIINSYTPVISLDVCKNKITVQNASEFHVGDTVLLIQMKGAVTDQTNAATSGNILSYNNAGNYEFNFIKTISGNTIELKNILLRQYDLPNGKVQLIRVPGPLKYRNNSTLTCLPWDGSKGGVVALWALDSIKLGANIDVSAKGFRGGSGNVMNDNSLNCFLNNYLYASAQLHAGKKGESISEIPNAISKGKGKSAAGGGGGLGHNSGGGGGANGGSGGFGGYQLDNCGNSPYDNRGIGGQPLLSTNALNKAFLGGGGGEADTDNGIPGTGGNGGGIVILISSHLQSNGFKILSNGESPNNCPAPTSTVHCHDGMGGGGAGGTLITLIADFADNAAVELKGGKGDNVTGSVALGGRIGPGGGGGGGIFQTGFAVIPPNVNIQTTGGASGVLVQDGNNPWGATAGTNGYNLNNVTVPISNIPFSANIDSVRFNFTQPACNTVTVNGLAYFNPLGNLIWAWTFGNGGTANTQNASHTYTNPGPYLVKLIVTDQNNCRDSIERNININCTASGDTIINSYTPVLSRDICKNKITVEGASEFHVGDTVLIIQMKGAAIDSSNTASFGNITNYKSAGNYEFNYIKSITGNIIELKNTLTRSYEIPAGKVQLIRVPYFQNFTANTNVTCLPWNGSKGGVVVVNAADSIILHGNIDASGKGFRGGTDPISNPPGYFCNENQFFYPVNPDVASEKGESIAIISSAKSFGKGAPANGGGGGNSHNSGGGGGANAGAGGLGGYEFDSSPCNGGPGLDNRGMVGNPLTYSNASNKIFLGGGGGGGQSNNPEAFESNGGNGAGIIIIMGNKLKSNGFKITANGNDAVTCGNTGSGCHEGMGGGGAGGTGLIKIVNYLDPASFELKGGNGASMTAVGFSKVGPGGGGGGGTAWISQASLPGTVNVVNSAGTNGVCTGYSNDPWGATAGSNGQTLLNLQIPVDNIPFTPNIDSVRFNLSQPACNTVNVNGLAYFNPVGTLSWAWTFGDGGTANTQNASHTYSAVGTYTIKLFVTDVNGCIDSFSRNVTTNILSVTATPAVTNTCTGNAVPLNASGAVSYSWSPATGLSNPNISNPVFNGPAGTHTFIVTGTGINGCTAKDTVSIISRQVLQFVQPPAKEFCLNGSVTLDGFNGNSSDISYTWTPNIHLSNNTINNPVANPPSSQTYQVTITDILCNSSRNFDVPVTVNPLPVIDALKSNDITCSVGSAQLSAGGASGYLWEPQATLNGANTATPVASPSVTTLYTVTGTDNKGCSNTDTVTVKVIKIDGGFNLPNTFTPNDDGLNDCFGIKNWGHVANLRFMIYNRWGEKVFETSDYNTCWNGKYKGQPADAGSYVYYVSGTTGCGPFVKKGNVILLK